MTLAVVMATRDGAAFLDEQLDSLARQTRPPDRLIVSDDGSSDGTPDMVRRFASVAPFPVTLLEGPGTGLADNFWHAAGAVRESLVAWADQDDVWHPDKLARCEQALTRTGAVSVTHRAAVVDDQLRPSGAMYPGYARDRVLMPLRGDPWHVPSGFATVFRSELLARVPFAGRPRSHQTGRAMNHDHVTALRAFTSAPRAQVADCLADYRQHGHNAAGDPTVRGLAAMRRAGAVGGQEYARQAEIAAEQGAWAATLPGAHPRTQEYFGALAERVARRAEVYEGGGPVGRGLRLARASRAGTYRGRSRGGFGARAVVRDTAAVVIGA